MKVYPSTELQCTNDWVRVRIVLALSPSLESMDYRAHMSLTPTSFFLTYSSFVIIRDLPLT